MDPRLAGIERRLAGVSRIIGVAGSKGGIGKSVVATSLALALADRGCRTGLFDLDFTSPSDHVVLGAHRSFPDEDFGIDPHDIHGVGVMSIAFFGADAAAPLRGEDTTNALLELLAITRWGARDILVLDLPPGLGDATLDVIRLMPRAEFLLLGTASPVVIESVRRALQLLTELRVPILGMVENMRRAESDVVAALAERHGVPLLGAIPFDPTLEEAFGDVSKLRATQVYAAVRGLAADVTAATDRPGPAIA